MTTLSKKQLEKYQILQIKVSGDRKAQKIISDFRLKAACADELTRIKLAKNVCNRWKKEKISFSVPAVPKRKDYWYLIQLLSQNHHVHIDKSPYIINFGRNEEIFIEKYQEKDFQEFDKPTLYSYQSLFHLLFITAKKMNLEINGIDFDKPTPFLTRENIDILLSHCGNHVIEEIGLNPNNFKLINIPYDISLRLSDMMNFGKHNLNTYFDGYRMRTNGKLAGLFGGNKLFGGPSFIDSFWKDMINLSIITRFVIIRRGYGLNNM